MNKGNLSKLADYLETEVKQKQFDMDLYRSDEVGRMCDFRSYHDCGTVGCALGWAPFVEGLEPIDQEFDDDHYMGVSLIFASYQRRVFDLSTIAWEWCFSDEWRSYDNTPKGAAKRIRYFVEHGQVPFGWCGPGSESVKHYQDNGEVLDVQQ